jgi:hypothetical protein
MGRGGGGLIEIFPINNPFTVHVIDAGYSPGGQRYEWAILGINCNYPIYVIARDPLAFKKVSTARLFPNINCAILEV